MDSYIKRKKNYFFFLSIDDMREREKKCIFNWLIDTVQMYLHVISMLISIFALLIDSHFDRTLLRIKFIIK